MNRVSKNQKGFSAFEAVLILLVVVLIGAVGYLVYKNHQKVTASNSASKVTVGPDQSKTTTSQQATLKYVTMSDWGVRVAYTGADTLTVSDSSCAENGDANGDTVNLGCQVAVNSDELTHAVGSCTAKVSGTVGYFYRMGPNDNYMKTNGAGFEPVAQWAADNPGKYTKIGSYYYAFAEVGKSNGMTGADVASSSDYNGTYTGCDAWQAEYKAVEPSVQALASKFETVPN